MGPQATEGNHWKERPFAAAVVRVLVFLIPVAGTIVIAGIAASLLPPATSVAGMLLSWIVFIGASSFALFGFERLARRLVPLSALLRMGLLFPEKGPSRLQMAKQAGRVRDLRQKVAEARAAGLDDEPTRAAENILTLLAALATHDRATRGHAERVRVFIDLLGEEMKLSQSDRERLRWAGILHDIGKLAVPVSILNKPGRPNEDEWKVLQSHPLEGARVVGGLMPWLGVWSRTIEDHHEKWDGTGYPRGLKKGEISLGGRIAAVADVYEALTAARAYKQPMSAAAARKEIAAGAGRHFDPAIARAFLNVPLKRLWRTVGVFSWLASLPFLARPAMAAQRAGGQSVTGAVAMVSVMTMAFVVAPFAQMGRFGPARKPPPPVAALGVVEAITMPPLSLPDLPAPRLEDLPEEPPAPPDAPRRQGAGRSGGGRVAQPPPRVEVFGVQINRGDGGALPGVNPPGPPVPPVSDTPQAPPPPPALSTLADSLLVPAGSGPPAGGGGTPPPGGGGGTPPPGGGGGGGGGGTPPPAGNPTYRNHGECVSEAAHDQHNAEATPPSEATKTCPKGSTSSSGEDKKSEDPLTTPPPADPGQASGDGGAGAQTDRGGGKKGG